MIVKFCPNCGLCGDRVTSSKPGGDDTCWEGVCKSCGADFNLCFFGCDVFEDTRKRNAKLDRAVELEAALKALLAHIFPEEAPKDCGRAQCDSVFCRAARALS